jgi:hypothetical protein
MREPRAAPSRPAPGRTVPGRATPKTAPRVPRRPSHEPERGRVTRERPSPQRHASFLHAFVPKQSWIDRIVRGRAWIPVLGLTLVAIVGLRVEVLKLSSGVGTQIQQASELQSSNATLRSSVSELSGNQRIMKIAETMGMVMPGPLDVHFVPASAGSHLNSAIRAIHTPETTAFLSSLVAERGADVTSVTQAVTTSAAGDIAAPANNDITDTASAGTSATTGAGTAATATSGSTDGSDTTGGTDGTTDSTTALAPTAASDTTGDPTATEDTGAGAADLTAATDASTTEGTAGTSGTGTSEIPADTGSPDETTASTTTAGSTTGGTTLGG